MKIAYVFQDDAADPSVQSGRPTSILREFERLGAEVLHAFPLAVPPSHAALAKKVGYRLLGRQHRGDRDDEFLDGLAAQFAARAGDRSYDLIFSPGSEAISRLVNVAPMTFCADATFANLVDYYWDFTGLSEEYRRKGHAQEAVALRRAALAVYSSEWAARSAIEDYGADPARVAVIPFGANVGTDNTRAEVMDWIRQRPAAPLRLLFVGRHWERKGGETVVATALCLIAHGHPVAVDIVGCDVPAKHRELPWLRAHGRLNQREPAAMAKLRALFAQAHFVFVPSQAEAFGLIFAEAGAFGLPAIATRTGGIGTAVRHDCNGLLLPLSSSPSDYADAIVAAFSDPARYRAFCRRAFAEFETRLNWRTYCRRYFELVHERLGIPPPAADAAQSLAPVA
ncbi:MAG TPA: glycosyltransferase family 4 protein [Opitutus sp.]|nr:glycosyltransferase family 4 protein [Opitutus sp.]